MLKIRVLQHRLFVKVCYGAGTVGFHEFIVAAITKQVIIDFLDEVSHDVPVRLENQAPITIANKTDGVNIEYKAVCRGTGQKRWNSFHICCRSEKHS